MTYYDEAIKEIEDLLASGQDNQAKARLEEELSMAYIPKEVEKRLREIEAEHKSQDVPPLTLEEIEEFLFSEMPELQLAGASALIKLNLRDHKDIIDAFLIEDRLLEAKVLLVDEMIAQGLKEEYTVIKNGIEYKFIPLYCERPSDSEGYTAAIDYLSKTIGSDDPSLASLCKELISRIAFMQLPLSLSPEEGIVIAKSVASYVYGLFDNERLKAYKKTIDTEIIDVQGIEKLLDGQ